MNYKLIIPLVAALTFGSCAKKEETVVPEGVAYDARFQKEFSPELLKKNIYDSIRFLRK